MTPNEFVAKWKQSELKERSGYQEHFLDLCRLLDHQTPAEIDPSGLSFAFEAGVSKAGGGQGWADVYKAGYFALEYKGKHASLDKAYQQLLLYKDSLRNPPLLLVSDFDRIIIHTNFTNSLKREYTLTLDDLLKPDKLSILRAVFFEPDRLKAPETTEQVTKEAAEKFAKLADHLRRWKTDPEKAAHFLIRVLFCLFAEDVDLLPRKIVTEMVEAARLKPRLFADQLRQLFGAMAKGGALGRDVILHFNGGLFDSDETIELDSDALAILREVSQLEWAYIEPSIFGTLFERSLDPNKRSQLGAHYTSKDDILLIVEPVLMAPLRQRWAEVKEQAEALAGQRKGGKARERLDKQLTTLLRAFQGEIVATTVLDAACGSGNFLYISLRLLLDLEKEVISYAGDLGLTRFIPEVTPAQLLGIEVNPYAHELAQMTVWIGYIQWLNENGFGFPAEPILKPLNHIALKDAIMALDEAGQPIEPAWPAATVIVGNPPFLGSSKLRSELGNEYTEALFSLYGDRLPASDLVCYWFEKARAMIETGKIKRAGLLATQGIRGGANRVVLERIKASGDIYWAQSDREWVLDGATVHVSMIGFDQGLASIRELDGMVVAQINADLSAQTDLTKAKRLLENKGICYLGTYKIGPFDIPQSLALEMIKDSDNPAGRKNADVVRPWVNGLDITRRARGMWIIDFGDVSEDTAALYKRPYEYVRRFVKPIRDTNNRERRKKYWWQHGETSPGMHAAVDSLKRFIGTPSVSKWRLFVWLAHPTIPDHQLVIFARTDNYFLGVLHSRIHELWARNTGTQLREAESGFRYTPTSTFETFPFPWPPSHEPAGDPRVIAIAEAARVLVAWRDAWLNPPGLDEAALKKRTLTNLYNERPAELAALHAVLDAAVFDAYGWPHDLSDDDILALLLALNLERVAAGETAPFALSDDAASPE